MKIIVVTKGTFQKRFSKFCPLRGYPPPFPLNGKSVWKKKDFFLNGIGGAPPLTEIPKKNSKKMGQKGLKLAFLAKNSRF